MTIGIAASCFLDREQRIVLCSDMRVEDEYIGSDTCVKFDGIGGHWVGLMSGDPHRARRLAGYYRDVLNDVTLQISTNTLVDVMSLAPRRLLSRLAEELIHSELRMTAEEFYHYASASPRSQYETIHQTIKELRIGCQFIIAGFIAGEAQLFQVEQDGSVTSAEHYVLIGNGNYEAHSILQERSYVRTIELLDAIYLVYEAKRWSEKCLGVGNRNTSLLVISPATDQGLGVGLVDPLVGIPFLDKAFGRFNLQPVRMGDRLPAGFFRATST